MLAGVVVEGRKKAGVEMKPSVTARCLTSARLVAD